MKNFIRHFLCLLVMLLLAACCGVLTSCGGMRAKPSVVRTTVTRPTVTRGFSLNGDSIMTTGSETTTTEAPYESPGFTAAGSNLFSRP